LSSAGRVCPLHYRYQPAVFARAPELHADTVLIAGGLYGNLLALDALQRLKEPQAKLIFNGDFNWFNVHPDGFAALNAEVLSHTAIRGNVETEIDSADGEAGCGCAYPADVDQSEVERSNTIMSRLNQAAASTSGVGSRLRALPMHLVAQVGDARIAIVHGDAWSLAGWEFAYDRLHAPDQSQRLRKLFADADVDIFASSHTCLPALRKLDVGEKHCAVINNGATGMPNFAGTHFGVATRISVRPCPPTIRLYGTRIGAVFVDAIKVHYDHILFVDRFLSDWPAGSAAHQSYFSRIINGPGYSPEMALGGLPGKRIRQRAR
jgi:hypothetical protein